MFLFLNAYAEIAVNEILKEKTKKKYKNRLSDGG